MWPPLRGTEEDREGRGGGASGSSDAPRGSRSRDEPGRPVDPPASAASLSEQTRPAARGLAGKEPPSGGGVAREGAGAAEWAEGTAGVPVLRPLGETTPPTPRREPCGAAKFWGPSCWFIR